MNILKCGICYDDINAEIYEEHCKNCKNVQQEHYKKISTVTSLSECQSKALEFAFKKSRIYSNNTKLDALYRFKKRGLDEKDMLKSIDYIQNNAQVIVHINLDRDLNHYINDDKYRNLFEVSSSGGCRDKSIRATWEDKLFNDIYKNAEPSQRVKYGAINLTNSASGILSCCGYGDSYFILKNKVKDRATFVLGDSSKMELHLGTFKYCTILLTLIPDLLLDNLIKIIMGQEKSIPYIGEYIEVQIHGSLCFSNDIEKLVVNKKYDSNDNMLSLVDKFCLMYNVPYIFTK